MTRRVDHHHYHHRFSNDDWVFWLIGAILALAVALWLLYIVIAAAVLYYGWPIWRWVLLAAWVVVVAVFQGIGWLIGKVLPKRKKLALPAPDKSLE